MIAGGIALSVKDLTVRFQDVASARPALNSVSFSLNAGETLGIVGESGAGKSTLGLSLTGLGQNSLAHKSGEIIFRGTDLASLDEAALAHIRGSGIGMIFQDARGSLDPAMPVLRQVEILLRRHRRIPRQEAAGRAAAMLAGMGLTPEILRRSPFAHQLSGGLCQRAAIAAALACEPQLLIADEPTSSLDTVTQAHIISLIQSEIRSRGLAMIFISHDLPLVASLADRLLILHQGSVVEQGATASVLSHPQSHRTRELISAWRRLSAEDG